MKNYLFLLLLVALPACTQQEPASQKPKENFIVNRVLIVNEQDEILMVMEQDVWAAPSFLYNKRQFLKESIDSLANAYGVKIASPKLHGQFSFKYDYEPYATIRNYYVARYLSGNIRIPEPMEEAKWVPSEQAIAMNTVTAIKQITRQIITYPNVVWGASFLVSHEGDTHPTKMVEDFYPLFEMVTEDDADN